MVIAQEPTQSLPALNKLRLVGDIRITREQQDVTLALVIPLDMIMFDIFFQRPPQRALRSGAGGRPWRRRTLPIV